MQKKKRPYSFSIVPNYIKPDKNLSPMAKLLFGEIVSLAEKEGYCFATNAYFQKMYDTSKSTVSQSISQLVEYEYIACQLDRSHNRKIYILDRPVVENDNRHDEDSTLPIVGFDDYNRKKIESNNKQKEKRQSDDCDLLFKTEAELYKELTKIFSDIYFFRKNYNLGSMEKEIRLALRKTDRNVIQKKGLQDWILSTLDFRNLTKGPSKITKEDFVAMGVSFSDRIFEILSS